jgi:hypothetical protein
MRVRPALITGACLSLSALAVATLAYLESATARADVMLRPEPTEVAPKRIRAKPAVAAGGVIATQKVEVASKEAAKPAVEAEPVVAVPDRLVAPDFTGKRFSVARREARELGLKVVARDEYGTRVPAEAAQYYRVRKQKTAVGAPVAKGDTIELRVREIASLVSGY